MSIEDSNDVEREFESFYVSSTTNQAELWEKAFFRLIDDHIHQQQTKLIKKTKSDIDVIYADSSSALSDSLVKKPTKSSSSSKKTKLESVPLDNLDELYSMLPSEAMKPKITRKSNISANQQKGLLITRYQLWCYIYQLGEMYRVSKYRDCLCALNNSDTFIFEMTGHHIAAAVVYSKIPFRLDDIKLMLNYFYDESSVITDELSDPLLEFRRAFNILSYYSSFNLNSQDVGFNSNKLEQSLKLFQPSSDNSYLNILVRWSRWCELFRKVDLSVQKNGTVW